MTRLKLYEKYDNTRKNGIMIDPNSYFDELKMPYDLKLDETRLKIKGHLENYSYNDSDGKKRSACFVSTSFGKHSIIITHLTKTICDEIGMEMVPLFLNNTLNLFPEEPAYWKKFAKRYNLENALKIFIPPKDENGKQITVWSVREKNGYMENFRNKKNIIYNPKTKRYVTKRSPDCCEQLKRESVNEYLMEDGTHLQCSFDGRLGVENNNRSRNALQRGCTYVTNFERPRPIRSFLPILYWTFEDSNKYIKDNFLPLCPSYEIHNLERMGCRNCVAYKSWMINLATNPTDLGSIDLKMNLGFMSKHEHIRMIEEIEYFFRTIKRKNITVNPKALEVISSFIPQKTLHEAQQNNVSVSKN